MRTKTRSTGRHRAHLRRVLVGSTFITFRPMMEWAISNRQMRVHGVCMTEHRVVSDDAV